MVLAKAVVGSGTAGRVPPPPPLPSPRRRHPCRPLWYSCVVCILDDDDDDDKGEGGDFGVGGVVGEGHWGVRI